MFTDLPAAHAKRERAANGKLQQHQQQFCSCCMRACSIKSRMCLQHTKALTHTHRMFGRAIMVQCISWPKINWCSHYNAGRSTCPECMHVCREHEHGVVRNKNQAVASCVRRRLRQRNATQRIGTKSIVLRLRAFSVRTLFPSTRGLNQLELLFRWYWNKSKQVDRAFIFSSYSYCCNPAN